MLARKKSRERSSIRNLLVWLSGGLVLAGVVYLVWFSGIFTVRTIEITGGKYSAEELGLSTGENILFWKPSIELKNIPRIASFGVEKKYFEQKVILNLEARDKYVIWCLDIRDGCWWVDRNGVIFSEAPDLKGPLIFRLVRDASDRSFSLGDNALDAPDLFPNLVAAFNFLDEIDLEVQEFRISDLKLREATATLKNGTDIYFSLTLDPNFGLEVVRSLRESGDWSIIKYLDLRVPNRAYYSG
jgi:hypothetical protein